MKLNFYNADRLDRNLKATAHKSGKLGFTLEAASKLDLTTQKSIGIATNGEDEGDRTLYIVVYETRQPGAFKVGVAGDYYYINTKPLFDMLKIDYVKDWVVFDIIEDTIENQKIFKLIRREKIKKLSNNT